METTSPAEPEAPAQAPAEAGPALALGSAVVIEGLVRLVDLNGRCGVVVRLPSEKLPRAGVRLSSGEEFNILPVNIAAGSGGVEVDVRFRLLHGALGELGGTEDASQMLARLDDSDWEEDSGDIGARASKMSGLLLEQFYPLPGVLAAIGTAALKAHSAAGTRPNLHVDVQPRRHDVGLFEDKNTDAGRMMARMIPSTSEEREVQAFEKAQIGCTATAVAHYRSAPVVDGTAEYFVGGNSLSTIPALAIGLGQQVPIFATGNSVIQSLLDPALSAPVPAPIFSRDSTAVLRIHADKEKLRYVMHENIFHGRTERDVLLLELSPDPIRLVVAVVDILENLTLPGPAGPIAWPNPVVAVMATSINRLVCKGQTVHLSSFLSDEGHPVAVLPSTSILSLSAAGARTLAEAQVRARPVRARARPRALTHVPRRTPWCARCWRAAATPGRRGRTGTSTGTRSSRSAPRTRRRRPSTRTTSCTCCRAAPRRRETRWSARTAPGSRE